MKTSATNRRVRVLISSLRDGTLVPNPDFQRRLVWTNKDKVNFLTSVMEEYPFPEIYVAAGEVDLDSAQGTEMLVDGQQRLTTLLQYFLGSDQLNVGKIIQPYIDLPPKSKERFLEYEVVVRDLGKLGIDEIKQVFRRLNSTSYSLNAMEVQNARYNGELKQFAESVATSELFQDHPVFSATDIRRMDDTRFALSIIVTILSTYFNLDRELDSYLENYNDRFEYKGALKKQLDRVFNFIESCQFERSSRVWKRADIFTLIVECHRALQREGLDLDAGLVGQRLKAFYKQVDESAHAGDAEASVARYYRAALQGSNGRRNRVHRGDTVAKILREPV